MSEISEIFCPSFTMPCLRLSYSCPSHTQCFIFIFLPTSDLTVTMNAKFLILISRTYLVDLVEKNNNKKEKNNKKNV